MVAGYVTTPQIQAQYNLLTDPSTKFPSEKLDVPLDLPCVPVPEKPKSADTGTVQLTAGSSPTQLRMRWLDSTGLVAFSGNTERIGSSELIDLNGDYSDRDLSMSVVDNGDGPKKTLFGTVRYNGVAYKLKGLRVWGRGSFTLFTENGQDVRGKGWIEWDPSTTFCQGLKNSGPKPTDQVMAYVQISKGGSVEGATHLLPRTAAR